MTFVLGITGGIATGKSSVVQHFTDLGFPVVDADLQRGCESIWPGNLARKRRN